MRAPLRAVLWPTSFLASLALVAGAIVGVTLDKLRSLTTRR